MAVKRSFIYHYW